MAENNPIPLGGALPPKPAEAAKVQPKKETVRINLPPKPTAAPTIKLPTLAPGSAPPSMGAAAPVASAAAPMTPRPAAAPPPSSAGARAAAPAVQRGAPHAATAPRPMPSAAVGLTVWDTVFAISAAVSTLAGLAAVLYLKYGLPDTGAF